MMQHNCEQPNGGHRPFQRGRAARLYNVHMMLAYFPVQFPTLSTLPCPTTFTLSTDVISFLLFRDEPVNVRTQGSEVLHINTLKYQSFTF